jgi:hypothetical protein
MLWITKYRHNQITAEYQKLIDNLTEQLNRKEKMEAILDKLVDKTNTLAVSMDGTDHPKGCKMYRPPVPNEPIL